jgi:hypothetical protein
MVSRFNLLNLSGDRVIFVTCCCRQSDISPGRCGVLEAALAWGVQSCLLQQVLQGLVAGGSTLPDTVVPEVQHEALWTATQQTNTATDSQLFALVSGITGDW